MIMMIRALFYLAVGICSIVLGFALWKKHNISLIHSSLYNGVRAEDVNAYTSLTGFGVMLLGIGICLSGLIYFASSSFLTRLPALAGLIAGFIFINKAQREYNGT